MTSLTIQSPSRSRNARILPYALWTAQALLAVTFLVAGVSKFLMSGDDLTKDIDLPVAFLRFIGACEALGAIGLILPGVLRIQRFLTPLAACGLVIIMIGATVITAATMGVAAALFPFAIGVVAAFVVYGRRGWFRDA